jgi:hypothetical protein
MSVSSENVTFRSLKSRLIKLLICALESEVDSHNTQLLLGGIVLCGRYLKNIGYLRQENEFTRKLYITNSSAIRSHDKHCS